MVPNSVSATTVTLTTTDAGASVTVNGAAVASGVASANIALAVPGTVITVVVTAENGTSTETYTVTVTRAPSSDATLSSLTLSAGPIVPSFDPSVTDYTVTVANAITMTTVTPVAAGMGATITVDGETSTSGAASSEIPLGTGETEIRVMVVAEDTTTTQTYSVVVTRAFASFDFVDPTPRASDRFGSQVLILDNGNVIVSDPFDSSVAFESGAVHLFDSSDQTLIGSLYGDQPGDRLGEDPITILSNGNYVIASPDDDDGGPMNTGAVRLVDGATGLQIGPVEAGSVFNDFLGSGGVVALTNDNYVVASPLDDVAGVQNAGSVRLIDGSTGFQITLTVGSDPGDTLGGNVVALANGNYVIGSPGEENGGVANVGSIRLIDGASGAQIGTTIFGDQANDFLGTNIVVLDNGNFVVGSDRDDDGPITDAGSVRLVDGITGAQIGVTVFGDQTGDELGSRGIVPLSNDNYVIASENDDAGATEDAGSVLLVNGSTGEPIGVAIAGDQANDNLGLSGIAALPNGNYVIASGRDDDGGVVDSGSVRLVNGSTGDEIGATIFGEQGDFLGLGGVTVLGSGNYAVMSYSDDEGSIVNVGSVRLFNGATGAPIGAVFGDQAEDQLGRQGVTVLANDNYVVSSSLDDNGTIVDAGSAQLVDGSSGMQIGAAIVGDEMEDLLSSEGAFALNNNHYLIASGLSTENGMPNVGSLRRINGFTGLAVGDDVIGETAFDLNTILIVQPPDGGFFILGAPRWDNNSLVDSGLVRLVTL